MIRRVYTNQLAIAGRPALNTRQIELVLDGATLTVDRKRDGQEVRTFASADEARAAFDAGVHALAPRCEIEAPEGEDPALAWVGPDAIEERWMRADGNSRETIDSPVHDDDVLADWQLEHADPHVRALGAFANGVRDDWAAHVDAWVSGRLPIADLGFRRGCVDTLHLAPPHQDGAGMVTENELSAFLRLPIAARLRRIVLGEVGTLRIGEQSVDNQLLVNEIGRWKLPALLEVELRGGEVRSLEALGALPALESIVIRDVSPLVLDRFASTTLQELVLQDTNWLELALLTLRCPALRSIAILGHLSDEALDGLLAGTLPRG